MGRPNLTKQRTTEILDAFERCVAQYGLAASSLERIAEEAGMKRSILRHYIGNRDELILALTQRVVTQYESQLGQLGDALGNRPVDALVEILLPSRPRESADSVLVFESLIAVAETHPEVKGLLNQYLDEVSESICRQLRLAFPHQSKQACWKVAYGVVCIWFNQESLSPLTLPKKYLQAARASMRLLIKSLE